MALGTVTLPVYPGGHRRKGPAEDDVAHQDETYDEDDVEDGGEDPPRFRTGQVRCVEHQPEKDDDQPDDRYPHHDPVPGIVVHGFAYACV